MFKSQSTENLLLQKSKRYQRYCKWFNLNGNGIPEDKR